MKQLLTILLFFLATGHAVAQQGLAINELFSGNIIPKERMVETRIRGRMLTDYKMSLFRSVKCKVSKEELDKINALVQQDIKGKTYCYICQKAESDGKKQWVVTLIYIESTLGTLSELKKMFNNK